MSDKDKSYLKRKAQLKGLGFTKDQIIDILSVFPFIGGRVKKEAKGGMVKKSTRK